MASMVASEENFQVDVNISGDFRRVAIAIEASGIGLRLKDDVWTGSKNIPLADPIDIKMTFKGAIGAKFILTLTINKIDQKFEGILPNGGVSLISHDFNMSNFVI